MDPASDSQRSLNHVIAVVGPTAVGKSELAERIAVLAQGEVISADSMQVYRGMDVGTAKQPAALRAVRHHCVDIVDPGEHYSAALFQRDARLAIDDCRVRGVLPILCGGTGLYVRAAVDDMEFPSGEQSHNPVRDRYTDLAERIGAVALHAMLAQRDAPSADLIHPNNVRRVVRAFELLEQGTSYALQNAGLSKLRRHYPTQFVGLTMERSALYARIRTRVDRMIVDGLLDEISGLLESGYRDALTSAQAIGYKELVPVVEGLVSLDEAVDRIKTSSTRYAKRQLTWFRNDPRITWIDVTELSPAQVFAVAMDALHLQPR